MRSSRSLVFLLLISAALARAQVLTPFEVKEPAAHRLQQRWLEQLQAIGSDIQAHQFPYKFYLSRQLDIDESRQLRLDQSSIRFDKFNGQLVLAITGNYYAAYSDQVMGKEARARKTFQDVVLPILQIAEPKFPADDSFAAFAIEISHHVRRRALGGVVTENPENLTFILPRAAAHHLVGAANADQAQAALLDSEVYLDAEPFNLWLTDNRPAAASARTKSAPAPTPPAREATAPPATEPLPTVSDRILKASLPTRLITPDTLRRLQAQHQDAIARMVAGLDSQAHFVSYVQPSFVGFHEGAYLQLSITSPLPARAGSRYQLAALAFDDHIAHLVRPVLAYFQQDADFDGISFSTTLKLPDGNSSEAVEFFFPFTAVRCYATYDCTGQQLIDSGIVLINGERASLNLQTAEAISARQ
jgi:hypothetical protein